MAHDLRDKTNCDNVDDDLEIEARDLEIRITNFVSTMKAKMEAARAERKGGKLCQLQTQAKEIQYFFSKAAKEMDSLLPKQNIKTGSAAHKQNKSSAGSQSVKKFLERKGSKQREEPTPNKGSRRQEPKKLKLSEKWTLVSLLLLLYQNSVYF